MEGTTLPRSGPHSPEFPAALVYQPCWADTWRSAITLISQSTHHCPSPSQARGLSFLFLFTLPWQPEKTSTSCKSGTPAKRSWHSGGAEGLGPRPTPPVVLYLGLNRPLHHPSALSVQSEHYSPHQPFVTLDLTH